MMKVCVVVLLSLGASMSAATECYPGICDTIDIPEVHCKGGTYLKGGFCGCYDSCARVEGETCHSIMTYMTVTQGDCDLGLKCHLNEGTEPGSGICRQAPKDVDLGYRPHHHHKLSQRDTSHAQTRCEQMRLTSMISMVVYEGQWFAKCDAQGDFLPMQCDNTQHCFCVDTKTGVMVEGSKVLGIADCLTPTSA